MAGFYITEYYYHHLIDKVYILQHELVKLYSYTNNNNNIPPRYLSLCVCVCVCVFYLYITIL